MQRPNLLVQTSLVAALLFAGSAQAAVMSTTIGGIAVGAAGEDETNEVGSTGNGDSLSGAIKYYIPLGDESDGTYGVTAVTAPSNACSTSDKAGTCSGPI